MAKKTTKKTKKKVDDVPLYLQVYQNSSATRW